MAIRSLRLLAIVSLVLAGLVLLFILLILLPTIAFGSRGAGAPPATVIAIIFMVYGTIFGALLGIGMVLLRCAKRIGEGSRGWAIAAMVMSIVLVSFSSLGLISTSLQLALLGYWLPRLVALIACVFFVLALSQLIYHLKLAMEVLHLVSGYRSRGFEVQVKSHGAPVGQTPAPPQAPPPMVIPPRPRL